MGLSDRQAKNAQPREKAWKLSDENGLYLLVKPNGSKLWRYKYTHRGKEKLLAIGAYPKVGLAEARGARDQAKKMQREGGDPSFERKIRRKVGGEEILLFEGAAKEWHRLSGRIWTPYHQHQVMQSFENYVFPVIGKRLLTEITPTMVLAIIRDIEKRPALQIARRVHQRISAVFVYGIGAGLCDDDPAAKVHKALTPKPMVKRRAAIVTIEGLHKLLRAVESGDGNGIAKLAHRFLALTAVRPGEVRGARWEEFEGLDDQEPIWCIPAERMKMRRPHVVPLSNQAVEVLRAIKPLTRRGMPFPNFYHANKPMSENAMNGLLTEAGYKNIHCAHGWRSSFSTLMNERHHEDRSARDIIDMMLAHGSDDQVEATYNRASYMKRRRELAQEWADLLLSGQNNAVDVLLHSR